jgi:hypothetical protein
LEFFPLTIFRGREEGSETQLCYEDVDGIKTEWLETLSGVQKAIAKKAGKRIISLSDRNTVEVSAHRLERKIQETYFVLSLALYTDIFFPWVLDQNSDHFWALRSFTSEDGSIAYFDNRVLAQRNAPRLNALIRDLSKLVHPYGEMIMEHGNDWMAIMIKPDGTIDLDFMPDNPQEPVNYWIDDDEEW